jgi:hypothetical protein
MAIRRFFCKKCKTTKRTFKNEPICCDEKMELIMTAPNTKILEPTDIKRGKSGIKNEDEILLERAKNYATDVDLDDLIQKNDMESAAYNGWLSTDYKTKRKKIDGK